MKKIKYLLFAFIILMFTSVIMIDTGCGAIGAFISAILASHEGFIFIPLLSENEKGPVSSQSDAVPGMILLNQNTTTFPGDEYGPLSGVTVHIEGTKSVAVTDENGHFIIDEVPEGTPWLTAKKDGYVSFNSRTVVSSEVYNNDIINFYLIPQAIYLISGRSYQFDAYGKTIEGRTVRPAGISWKKIDYIWVNGQVVPDNGNAILDSDGVFTGITPDGVRTMVVYVTAEYGNFSQTCYIDVSKGAGSLYGKVTDEEGNSVSGARVEVLQTPYFALTDENGNYFFPEVPTYYPLTVTAETGNKTASVITQVPEGGSQEVNLVLMSHTSGFIYRNTIGTTGISGKSNQQFCAPRDIAFDKSGNFYVSDLFNNRIQKFSSSNIYLSTMSVTYSTESTGFLVPAGIGTDGNNNLYVADFLRHKVDEYDSSGNYLRSFGVDGEPGMDNNHFNGPFDVAVDSKGNIYISDSGNHRVQKLDSEGNYLMTLGVTGEPGTDNSHFGSIEGPAYISIDGDDNLYVSDSNPNTRVQIFNSSGIYMATIGITGSISTDNDHLYVPGGIAFDSSGNIFIADSINHRVQMFDSNRNYVDTAGVTGFAGMNNDRFDMPNSVGINPLNGEIYVVDMVNHRIQIFER